MRRRLERAPAGQLAPHPPAPRGARVRRVRACLHRCAMLMLCVCALPGCGDDVKVLPGAGVGSVDAARPAFQQYACTSCHVIPGIVGANTHVGPPLDGLAQRRYLAGSIANTPVNLVRWIRDPRAIAPGTAMPDLGVGGQAALDMAAYLYTLDEPE